MIHLLRMPADIFLSTLLGRKSRKLVKGRNMPLSTEAPGVGLYDLWRSLLSPQSVAGGGRGAWCQLGTAAPFQQPVKQLGGEENCSQMLELESPHCEVVRMAIGIVGPT